MEYYQSIKTGVEIRRVLTSCNDVELASFMAKLTELLIKSDKTNLIYTFIVNLSKTQNYDILKQIELILPTNCLIKDSIAKSKSLCTLPQMQTSTNLSLRLINRGNTASTDRDNNKSKKYNILNRISSDVLLKVFNYLDFYNLQNLERTCRYFYCECHHPKALYQISYSFDNEHVYNGYSNKIININSLINYNYSRFSNIKKLSLSHEYGEFDQDITNKQFNRSWFKNVTELNCLFATEYIESCNFNQFLQLKSFHFENVDKLWINLSNQHAFSWLNLILNNIVNANILQQLHLSHILESVDLMKLILKCKNLKVLKIRDLDFPTLRYYDSTEYYEFFERDNISLPNIRQISYIDSESCVGINEWLQFIGFLIKNVDDNNNENKIDLSLSFRCQYDKYNVTPMNVLFGHTLNTKQIICKLNNLSINIDDAMVNSIKFLSDKLLEFDHRLNALKISGMIIKNGLNFDLLYEKLKHLFNHSNKARILFSDYYRSDSLRISMTNPSFLSWVQKLVKISTNKVFIDFKSRI